jgi:hypothetical protein
MVRWRPLVLKIADVGTRHVCRPSSTPLREGASGRGSGTRHAVPNRSVLDRTEAFINWGAQVRDLPRCSQGRYNPANRKICGADSSASHYSEG